MKEYTQLRRRMIRLAFAAVCCTSLSVAARATGQYKVLYRFAGPTIDGFQPQNLVVAPSGSLFGVVTLGGMSRIFKLDPPGAGQTQWQFSVIYSYNGRDGIVSLLVDNAGNLYCGTAVYPNGPGTVIRLAPPAAGQTTWTAALQPSHYSPTYPNLISLTLTYRDSSGVLFGYDDEAIFKATPPRPTAPNGIFSRLTTFGTHYPVDGLGVGSLILGQDGAFYGTTIFGGGDSRSQGILFRLTPSATGASPWNRQNLYVFGDNDLAGSPASIIADRSLTFYGVSGDGGSKHLGVIFRLMPPAAGQTNWRESLLYTFRDSVRGAHPDGALVNHAGVLFGIASDGGANSKACYAGCGSLFKLTAPSDGPQVTPWNKETLHIFAGSPSDGGTPLAGPVGATLPDGTFALFGITLYGGISTGGFYSSSDGWGAIYEYIP